VPRKKIPRLKAWKREGSSTSSGNKNNEKRRGIDSYSHDF
jgi:hypothetical protein